MLLRTLTLAAVLGGPAIWAGEPQIPGTPAGREFSAWLSAFNSGDRATLRKFLETHHPARVKDLDEELEFRQETGGFEVKKVEESAALRLSGLVKERDSEQFARFVMEVEPADPHRIKKLELRAIPRPSDFPVGSLSETELITGLRAKLEKDAAADRFSG